MPQTSLLMFSGRVKVHHPKQACGPNIPRHCSFSYPSVGAIPFSLHQSPIGSAVIPPETLMYMAVTMSLEQDLPGFQPWF